MKYLKRFNELKLNTESGIVNSDDIRKCIRERGVIYSDIVLDLPSHKKENELKPIDIDDEGLITVEIDSKEYSVEISDVIKVV